MPHSIKTVRHFFNYRIVPEYMRLFFLFYFYREKKSWREWFLPVNQDAFDADYFLAIPWKVADGYFRIDGSKSFNIYK